MHPPACSEPAGGINEHAGSEVTVVETSMSDWQDYPDFSDYDNGRFARLLHPYKIADLTDRNKEWLKGWHDFDAELKGSQDRACRHFFRYLGDLAISYTQPH